MNSKKKRSAATAIVPVVVIIVGIVLMVGKIIADSEPGAIPILLVTIGAVWYLAVRRRGRPHQN